MVDFNVKPDAIMTPILWAYNQNLNENVQICCGDLPKLIWYERVANSLKADQMK